MVPKHFFSLHAALVAEQQRRRTLNRQYDWDVCARPDQLPPKGAWHIWLIMAGRGFGKTRTGAETVRRWIETGQHQRVALVGSTLVECRSVMVEGVSGILSVAPPAQRPVYEPSKRLLRWPNGAVAQIFTAETPDQLRGPQFDAAWVDEIGKFRNPDAVFDQLMMALRLGTPHLIITTTPRPLPLLHKLVASPGCVVTRGASYANKDNLSRVYTTYIAQHYENSIFGQQEVLGQLIEGNSGALWCQAHFHYLCEKPMTLTPEVINQYGVRDCILGIDPAVTGEAASHETGMILVGRKKQTELVVLGDFSLHGTVEMWGRRVRELCHLLPIKMVVVEVNQGGDVVTQWLKQLGLQVAILPVRATRSKWQRASQAATYYALDKVWHLHPLIALEERLLRFTFSNSQLATDRVDALVWALITLQDGQRPMALWI